MDVGSQRKYKQSLDTLVEERQSGRRHGVDEMRQAEQRRVALAVRRHLCSLSVTFVVRL